MKLRNKIILLLTLILCSCSTTKNVERTLDISKEYIYKTDTFVRKDTLLKYDSIFVKLCGDTTYIEKWHTAYKTKYEYLNKVDTVYKTDTIFETKYKVIQKTPSLWNKIKSFILGALGGIITTIIVLFLKKKI